MGKSEWCPNPRRSSECDHSTFSTILSPSSSFTEAFPQTPRAWGLSQASDIRYGISSFVYSSRRPFHPKRLWEVVSAPFCVIQTEFEEEEDSDDEAGPDEDDTEDSSGQNAEAIEMAEDQAKLDALAKMEEQKAELDLPARAAFKRGSEVWKGVLRSKGFIWLATRPNIHGEWSQAGVS